MITWKRSFSDADWQATPEAVKKDFIGLEGILRQFEQQLQQLEEQVKQLTIRINKNSTNSDKPPSTDNPYRQRAKKSKNKGRTGAKAGHKGHRPKLNEPTKKVPLFPDKCKCGSESFKNCKPFYVHQEIELPEIQMEITHFVLYQGTCFECGQTAKASLPGEHRFGYGVRLSSFIANAAGVEAASRTTIQAFCRSVLKFDISLGAVQKVIDRVSEAIQPHYQAIAEVARTSDVNGIDETSWKKNGILMFLWAMVNSRVAFFKIHQERSKKAFLALIENWRGILISDGYNVYQKWVNLRQTCLAHLIRYAKGLSEHPKREIREFGEAICIRLQQLCSMATEKPDIEEWNEFYTGFIDLICDNCTRYCKDEAGKFARRLLKEIDSLWLFLEVSGVEPTNNASERGLRFGVLWRKRSQGTRSDKGNRWVERILTLRQTARLRNMSCFDILVDAMHAYFKEQKPDLSWIYA
jgi:transposase